MNIETVLLNKLKAAQQQFAVEALRKPITRDAFEYGYRTGIVEGYEASINVLLSILDEEKHDKSDL